MRTLLLLLGAIPFLLGCGGQSSSTTVTASNPQQAPKSPADSTEPDGSPAPPKPGSPRPSPPAPKREAPKVEPATPQAAPAVADDGYGVPIGATVNFQLPDQAGKSRTLAEVAGEGRVAIVFHRSADW